MIDGQAGTNTALSSLPLSSVTLQALTTSCAIARSTLTNYKPTQAEWATISGRIFHLLDIPLRDPI